MLMYIDPDGGRTLNRPVQSKQIKEADGPRTDVGPPTHEVVANPHRHGESMVTLQQKAGNRAITELFKPARVGGRLSEAERDADVHARTALESLPAPALPPVPAFDDAGTQLEASVQHSYAEAFAHDFSQVRVHAGPEAARATTELGTPAYALGQHIVVGSQVASLAPAARQALLAHELAHVVQASRQAEGEPAVAHRAPPPSAPEGAPAKPNSPAGLPPGRYKVILVGAPGKAEIDAHHPLQFVKAAAQSGRDAHTVWLVERTGYQLGKVPESDVEAQAEKATVFWIDPGHGLVEAIKSFPPHSIERMEAYGHGTPGLLAMRHGWDDQPDYGLTTAEAQTMSSDAFTPDATISFDSCNSAAVAAAIAESTERPATGWAGRTTYHDVNEGTGGPRASEVFPSGGGFDIKEAGSWLLKGEPHQVTFAPSKSSGDFESVYSMTARLPRTRTFEVGANGSVGLKITADSDYTLMQGGAVTVILHRERPWYRRDEDIDPTQEVKVGSSATLSWSGLEQGTYYIELFHLSGMLVEGKVAVTIR
jgi:hypothetical protein